MTTNERFIWIANILASRALAQAGLINAVESDCAHFLEQHPVLCTGEACYIHTCFHRERSMMRRQAKKQRGHLTRPQARRWEETQAAFQWLWDMGVIDAIEIATYGSHCYNCSKQRDCQFAPYYLGR